MDNHYIGEPVMIKPLGDMRGVIVDRKVGGSFVAGPNSERDLTVYIVRYWGEDGGILLHPFFASELS